MGTEVHTFDPDGDLLFILSRPVIDDSDSDDSDSKGEPPADDTTHTPTGSEVQRDAIDGAMELASPEGEAGEEAAGTLADLCGQPENDPECEEKEPDVVVHMLVSSKHLMLASPVFKAMLQHNNFKEGKKLTSAGKVEVPLPDDDVTAFIIVLDVIHGRNKRVPRKVTLEMLTKISIIVDKYQMAEVVESYSDGWIDGLMEDFPTKYAFGDDTEIVHRWLGISWVFGKDDEFNELTQLVERGCWADLEGDLEEGLPIPDLIICTFLHPSTYSLENSQILAYMLERRQGALFELYGMIEQTITRYQRSDTLCPRTDNANLRLQCDYLLLGSLIKSATTLGIMPVPEPPYGNISFDELADKLYSLDVQAICDSIDRPKINGKHPKPAHGLKKVIQEKIESLEERLSGLDIQEFKKEGQNIRPIVGV